jgi:hypothetical protein
LINIAARFGLLLCAAGLAMLAYRLHSKAKGKRKAKKKTAAVILMFLAGLALAGTFVGSWMTSNMAGVGGYLAAALILFTVGPVLVDWIGDGEPDKVALWCTVAVPLALFIGVGQLAALGELLQQQGHQLSHTVSSQMRR